MSKHQSTPLIGTDLILPGIVTPHTKQVEKEIRAKEEVIPWRIQPRRAGITNFFEIAGDVLAGTNKDGDETREKGLVVFAPHAERVAELSPFPRGSISLLDNSLVEKGIGDDFVYFLWALEIPGNEDYAIKASGRYNSKKTYRVNMGPVVKAPDFRVQATKHGRTLEEEAHAIMLDLVPEAYKPKQRGDVFP